MVFDDRVKKDLEVRAKEIETLLHRKGTDAFKEDPQKFLSALKIEITPEQAEEIKRQLSVEEEKKEVLTASSALSIIYVLF
ncbi:MAG: hypothetical protein ACTSR2_05070 [Candidatus Hodarchaeales archaeon]